MKVHLNISPVVSTKCEIFKVVDFLEDKLDSPHDDHGRMTMRGFFMAKRWRIDHCITHWELVLDEKHARDPWFVELVMRWG